MEVSKANYKKHLKFIQMFSCKLFDMYSSSCLNNLIREYAEIIRSHLNNLQLVLEGIIQYLLKKNL